ncbi:hypothetical protein COLO4_29072 [Corchorus olitorius]|uniref:F-box domain-containing protein n=1 Tax=Corchorus olitorius TaxID=93759 RepID=A0A1R3HGJ0_9ROSI|nr:hypothetical protein COLO4_29072 [Corchorus olitorius]
MASKHQSSKLEVKNIMPHQSSKLEVKNMIAHQSSKLEVKVKNMMFHQSQLPEEICMEILERLPVRSLIRFKAICKSWKSLISTPNFSDRHFDRSVASSNKLGIILTKEYKFSVPNQCVISFHTLNFSPTSFGTLNFSPTSLVGTTFIEHWLIGCKKAKSIGWCRGILLLGVDCSYYKLLLWNPSTRESKEIPDPPYPLEYEGISASALGYDYNVKSHKIVLIYKKRGCENCISVYTLKTNLWTSVDLDTDHKVANYDIFPITLVNGAPHWVIKHGDVYGEDCDNIHHEIEYFDFAVNNFLVVPQPGEYDSPPELYDTGGEHLCIGYETYEVDGIKLEIWVMKRYGVKDSWSKWMTFEDNKVPLPICFAKNINVSLKSGGSRDGRCAIYNGKKKGTKVEFLVSSIFSRNSFGFDHGLRKKAFTFYESLICLEPEEVEER